MYPATLLAFQNCFIEELSAWTDVSQMLLWRVCSTDGHFLFSASVKQQKYILRSLRELFHTFRVHFSWKSCEKYQNFEFLAPCWRRFRPVGLLVSRVRLITRVHSFLSILCWIKTNFRQTNVSKKPSRTFSNGEPILGQVFLALASANEWHVFSLKRHMSL